MFVNGSSTSRSVAENTASDTNIGSPVVATDADGDVVTYNLGGTDVSLFSIDGSTGQLLTSATLDYETKTSYTVTITAADGNGRITSITVTINITNANDNAPVFNEGSSTTLSIAENTASGKNIGSAVSATDVDGDTLTYSLSGTDADSFSIDSETGQLQTKGTLDHETKSSYTVIITADDGNGSSTTITVTVNVTNVNEAPAFNSGYSTTLSVSIDAGQGAKIGNPFTATDPDGDNITYSLVTNLHLKIVLDANTGQLKTGANFVKGITVNAGDSLSFKIYAHANLQRTPFLNVTVNVVEPGSAPATHQSPTKTELLANYPNPFNPETWIPYQLSESAKVTVTIYNVKGEMVRHFALGHQAAGDYRSRARAIHWDGKNQFGEKVSTGVYFYRFTAGDFSATRRMLIIK